MTYSADDQKAFLYEYNDKKWLKTAKYGYGVSNNGGISMDNIKKVYWMPNIEYDANGNITTLERNAYKHGVPETTKIDDLSYRYYPGTNRLERVADFANDPSNLGYPEGGSQLNNYVYNSIGQLIKHIHPGLDYYNAAGLITEVTKNGIKLVKFYYNERGQRISKESFNNVTGQLLSTDYYVSDFSGNVIAIYNKQLSGGFVALTQLPVYGGSRLGMYNKQDNSTLYELTDHIGNVRVTFTKQNSQPVMQSWVDYYPFGMAMPNRNYNSSSYRYTYQGQEKDSETGMEAFELRLWDGRIGRWLTPDPYAQYDSPYLGMGNNPISMIDPDGGFAHDGCCDWFKNALKSIGNFFSPEPEYTDVPETSMWDGELAEVSIEKVRSKTTVNRASMSYAGAVPALLSAGRLLAPVMEITVPVVSAVEAPVIAAVGIAGMGYYAYNYLELQPTTITEADARSLGISLSIAGNINYGNSPQNPGFSVEEILALQALSAEMVHQMGKGKQGQWDDELSPLTDSELLELLREAIATANSKLKLRIIREQKRRGTRNKGKDRGRGDVK